MGQFQSDDFKRSRKVVVHRESRKKGLAAMLVSLVFFVPIAPLVGAFMGFSARRMNAKGAGGSSLASVAVLMGLVFTIGQCFLGYRGAEWYWQVTAGPGDALTVGFAGHHNEFVDRFAKMGSPAEAQAFINQLRTRYGDFRVAFVGQSGADSVGTRRYSFVFDQATINGEASVVCEASFGVDWLTSKLASVTIKDVKQGDLTFPARSRVVLTKQDDDH